MRLQSISSRDAANAWPPQFIRAFNRRFAVAPARPDDGHVPYAGNVPALCRILLVYTSRRLSNSLSCQHGGLLYQVQSADQGLALRGTEVTIVIHPQSAIEILWQARVLPCTFCSKPKKQSEAIDGKNINDKVDQAVTWRQPPQPVGHPWKKRMDTKPVAMPVQVKLRHAKPSFASTPEP